MERILVTGASGFVGGHLMPRLRAAFPSAKVIGAGLADVVLDIRDPRSIETLVRDVRPDACIHLAAIAVIPAARRDPTLAWEVNLHGTLSLAASLMRVVPDCVLVYPSSADCYGASFRLGHALDETAPLAPMNVYGSTKAAADLALGALVGDGLRVIRVRPFNHTGTGQTPDLVVPAFARQVARIAAGLQPPVMHVGALDPLRDFLDVRDVCDAYVACLLRADAIASGTIFNIASGIPRRIGDVLGALLALAGIEPTIETGANLLRKSEIPTASGNAAAASAALGWKPAIPWEQTLRDVLADWDERVRSEAPS